MASGMALPAEAGTPELTEPPELPNGPNGPARRRNGGARSAPVRHGKRAQARRMAAPRPEGTTAYGKILSIFCFMVSAVKGLTM